jgi:hypothetical protein
VSKAANDVKTADGDVSAGARCVFRRNVSSIALCESQGRCGSGTMIIYSGAMIEALVKYAGILCLVNVIKLAAQYAAIKKEK